jgi:hypothetical protein
MRPLVRILVLWILIASLPVQGIAAAIKFPCTMAHTSIASAGAEAMDDCDDPDMMMPSAQPTAQEHDSAVVAHQKMPCDQDGHQKHSSCPACSACSVGASAPPPVTAPNVLVEHFASDYLSPVYSFSGWIPSRIERPPRL